MVSKSTLDNYRQTVRNDYFVGNLELKFTPLTGLDIVARQGVTTKNSSSKSTVGGFNYTDYSKNTLYSSKSDISASVADGSSYKTNLSTTVYAQYNRTIATNYSFS